MKKILIILPLLFVAHYCFAWECLDGYDKYKDPIEAHISKASEIIYGTLVSGSFDPNKKYGNNISFEISILKSFKGELSKNVTLTTSKDAYFGDLILGNNYIIFLYGGKQIDFCGVVVELGEYYNRVGRLNEIWDGNLNSIQSLFDELAKKK